jgi:hypothetical protein
MTKKLSSLYDKRYEPRHETLEALVIEAPMVGGHSTGWIKAVVAGVAGVPVRVPTDMRVAIAPYDTLEVRNMGTAAAADYQMVGRIAGDRANSDTFVFSQPTTILDQTYPAGDILLGSTLPGWSNWWYQFVEGRWVIRQGLVMHGAIGNLTNLYGYPLEMDLGHAASMSGTEAEAAPPDYGVVFGEYGTAEDEKVYLTMDPTHGFRIMRHITRMAQIYPTGVAAFGEYCKAEIVIDPVKLEIDFLVNCESIFKVTPGNITVTGRLFVGRWEGPHAGMFERAVEDVEGSGVSTKSYHMEAVDLNNVPVFSAGALDGDDPDEAWCNIGREGYPRIHFESVTGFDRKLPIVDAALLSGTPDLTRFNITGLSAVATVRVVDSLDGLTGSEGNLILLRKGGDSGALYVWTRWGPEPVGGFHASGPHDHTDEEGEQLAQANTHQTPDTDAATSSLHHTLGTGATQAAAGDHVHSLLPRIETDTTTEVAGDKLIVANKPTAMTVNLLPATGSGRVLYIKNIGFAEWNG